MDDGVNNLAEVKDNLIAVCNDMKKAANQKIVEQIYGNWEEYKNEGRQNYEWIKEQEKERRKQPESFDETGFAMQLQERI